jgi:D-psicose/D-tagatose/L-ribulose 3-epimerase
MVRWGMHFSLWAAEWTRQAAEAAVPEAAKYGIEVIEIPLLAPESIDVAHARSLLAEYVIAPAASLCLPENMMAQDRPAVARDFLLRALDTAQALGCKTLGGVTYSALGYKTGKPPTPEEYRNIVLALKPVAQRAAQCGVKLGLEPCNRYETHLLNTAQQTKRLIEDIGEPNLFIHLDTYHMNIEEKGIGSGFRCAGNLAQYIHASESDRGVPGTGTVDWGDVFAALKTIGFNGDIVVESFVTLPPEIAKALCVWRPVASDRRQVLEAGLTFLRDTARRQALIN